ncbi:MAG: hypothetical protein M0036_02965 [Desulfobacteraceae bacterium]|nr:hypothetical protein [Desulfobacteraceae bacterium]
MSTKTTSKNIEQLMAEADELIAKINSEALQDLQEEHRLEVEKHAQNLKRVKSEVQHEIAKSEAYKISHSAEGIHEAFQEITKAMGQLKRYLSGDRPDAVK